jgi:hypothetical protein
LVSAAVWRVKKIAACNTVANTSLCWWAYQHCSRCSRFRVNTCQNNGTCKAENNFDVSVLADGRKLTPLVVQRETDSSKRRIC